MGNELERQLRLLGREAWRHKLRLSLAFVLLASLATAAGAVWPKVYTSSTTVMIEEKNIIDPLLEGRAVRSDVYANAQQKLNSRGLLRDVLEQGGWIDENTPPAEVEQQMEAMQSRIEVENAGENDNLVEIIYQDSDPDRAFETVQRLAKSFIDEMRASKTGESRAAYEFIDLQVNQYEDRLARLQDRMRKLREENPRAQPDAGQAVAERVNQLRTQIEDLEQEIREAEVRERTLQDQLSGEVEVAELSTAKDQRRQRIAELQAKLETLRLSYHETYPDIVRIKEQLADLRASLDDDGGDEGSGSGNFTANGRLRENPVYQELQGELYQVRSEIQLKTMRRGNLQNKLDEAMERTTEVRGVQAQYEEFERDYQVNRDIYQDLLRRRENARLSMNLDSEQEALTLRINEPAYRPHDPSGPRMLHFAIGGVVVGAGLPLSLLFGLLLVDPRVRSAERLTEDSGVVVLQTVPHLASWRDRAGSRLSTFLSALLVIATLAGVVAALVGRQIGYL